MPADPSAIDAHAKTLHADSDSLAECAIRLGDIAHRLRETTTVPAWFQDVMNEHVTRCLVASTDLRAAAARLEEYASTVALPQAPSATPS